MPILQAVYMRGFNDAMRHCDTVNGVIGVSEAVNRRCDYGYMRDTAGLMSQQYEDPSLTRDLGGHSALLMEIARKEVETKFELLSRRGACFCILG